jgi:ABC-type lipoprotein export system ATPase subunit
MNQPGTATPLIEAHGITRVYLRGQEKVEALRNINLEIQPGTFNVIVGPSGGGKSTLLHLLGGIDRPTSGSLLVKGVALESASEVELTRFRRDHIGFVFQFFNLLSSISALENVAMPLLAKGWRRRDAMQRAAPFLKQVGLDSCKQRRPGQLSGGEQQRVAIARAVAGEPCLVLADEPTGDLDANTSEEVMKLMLGLNRQLGTTFIVATHNERFAAFADRLFELRSGLLSETIQS